MTFPHGQTVTVLRSSPGGFDAYGDPITSTTTETDIGGCAVADGDSYEPTARGREGVVVDKTLYAPFGSDILFTDRIISDGVEYRIEGSPALWQQPMTGTRFGMTVALVRAVG